LLEVAFLSRFIHCRQGHQWDLAMSRHGAAVQFVAFRADDKMILAGSLDRSARRWHMPVAMERGIEELRLWSHAFTGMELDAKGVMHILDARGWKERRQLLEELSGQP